MINELSTDGDGTLDFSEFLSLMTRNMKDADDDEELAQAFKHFDRDRDGFIDAQDLRTTMASLGENLTKEEVDEMIREGDILDTDGKLNVMEFVNVMAPERVKH